MADKVLTFHTEKVDGNTAYIGAAYYMEADCEKVAVRIHAATAPNNGDAQFDIEVEGASIIRDRKDYVIQQMGVASTFNQTATTTIVLPKGDNYEEMAGDFASDAAIEDGSWVRCKLVNANGANNITVQLELDAIAG
jgi:hypothetical protein